MSVEFGFNEATKLLAKPTGLKTKEVFALLETPPDQSLGNIAFPCFSLAKERKKSPMQIAMDIIHTLDVSKSALFIDAKPQGPYVNLFFDKAEFSKQVLSCISKEKSRFGFKKPNKKVVVLESPSPNTNKPLHIGHVRNMVLSESVSRILESQGYRVKPVNLNNDRGIHICKSMLAYQLWGKNKKPDKKSDHFVGDYYVLFSQKAKEHEELQKEAQDMLVKWENNDPEVRALWKKMNAWALDGFYETYKRFGLKFDKEYFESDIYERGKKLVLDGVKKGVFKKREDGAVIIDLGKPLGEKVLLRADGTSVYITQDLYLAKQKYADFHYDQSLYVVANEQDYHFKVLFEILNMLKLKAAKGVRHLSYGMIGLPTGRIKSREGTTVDADDLLDELAKKAQVELEKRKGITKKQMSVLSEKIGLGALRYYILKYSAHKDFVFKPDESISFEGETGPYLQYALVRAKRIEHKVGKKTAKPQMSALSNPESQALIHYLARFPFVVEESANRHSPHTIAEYAFLLASKFNAFYEKNSVLHARGGVQTARLKLVNAYVHVLSSCLSLLAIEPVEKM
ncbi:arginine--tRNA ligase [archaeon CG10_big_fil_rev_8_21_14_0_10_43_11]|nr:MAG: arginine--tRNA ligase [archaeon CG10_big_fil_rev_8_21_14_0_10_43_11]